MRIYQNEKDLLSFYLKIIFLIDNKKSDYRSNRFSVIPLRFERRTHALEGRCSIQLSYGTILNGSGAYGTRTRDPMRDRHVF